MSRWITSVAGGTRACHGTGVSRLYGDYQPFPHDLDYLEVAEASFRCAVTLVTAENSIRNGLEQVKQAVAAEQVEKAALGEVLRQLETVGEKKRNSQYPQVESLKCQALDAIRKLGARSSSELASDIASRKRSAEQKVKAARAEGFPAVEKLLRKHAPLNTSHEFQLKCLPGEHLVLNSLTTPFALEAHFSAPMPSAHLWAGSPRVIDFAQNVEISVTRRVGWFFKQPRQIAERLDRFFVTHLRVDEHGGSFRLRKALGSCAGFELFLNSEAKVPVAAQIVESDSHGRLNSPFPLQGVEANAISALFQAMVHSVAELRSLRTALVSARYENQVLGNDSSPLALAKALVEDMAPLVAEISRRSGVPGELILRRTIGSRSREESYLKKAELLAMLSAFPAELRQVFEPLRLGGEREVLTPLLALSRPVQPPARRRLSPECAAKKSAVVDAPPAGP